MPETNISHTCLLCMGSNLDARLHLKNAEESLQRLFPGIEWGEIVETQPERISNPQPFLNRAARIHTSLAMTEVRSLLKEIEQTNGRTPQSKEEGRIPLDIDLLTYDQQVLKPLDLKKNTYAGPSFTPVSHIPAGYSVPRVIHSATSPWPTADAETVAAQSPGCDNSAHWDSGYGHGP